MVSKFGLYLKGKSYATSSTASCSRLGSSSPSWVAKTALQLRSSSHWTSSLLHPSTIKALACIPTHSPWCWKMLPREETQMWRRMRRYMRMTMHRFMTTAGPTYSNSMASPPWTIICQTVNSSKLKMMTTTGYLNDTCSNKPLLTSSETSGLSLRWVQ